MCSCSMAYGVCVFCAIDCDDFECVFVVVVALCVRVLSLLCELVVVVRILGIISIAVLCCACVCLCVSSVCYNFACL